MNRGLGLCRPLPYRLAMVPYHILYASGGNNRTRTYDPLLVRQMLSQLSYAPMQCLSIISNIRNKINLFYAVCQKKYKFFFLVTDYVRKTLSLFIKYFM